MIDTIGENVGRIKGFGVTYQSKIHFSSEAAHEVLSTIVNSLISS